MIKKLKNLRPIASLRLAIFMVVFGFALVVTSTSVNFVYAATATAVVNCTWFQEVVALTKAGSGSASAWTHLDNNALHGYVSNDCPYNLCTFYYESSHPPLTRQIDLLEVGGNPPVSIWYHQCKF